MKQKKAQRKTQRKNVFPEAPDVSEYAVTIKAMHKVSHEISQTHRRQGELIVTELKKTCFPDIITAAINESDTVDLAVERILRVMTIAIMATGIIAVDSVKGAKMIMDAAELVKAQTATGKPN